jgi:hypothetical protein
MANKKTTKTRSEMRALRTQQILFIAVGIIVILSMLLSMLR